MWCLVVVKVGRSEPDALWRPLNRLNTLDFSRGLEVVLPQLKEDDGERSGDEENEVVEERSEQHDPHYRDCPADKVKSGDGQEVVNISQVFREPLCYRRRCTRARISA